MQKNMIPAHDRHDTAEGMTICRSLAQSGRKNAKNSETRPKQQ